MAKAVGGKGGAASRTLPELSDRDKERSREMRKRINNLSARLMVNDWLVRTDRAAISGELSYIEFATELRKLMTQKLELAPFHDRADAVSYVRYIAHQHVS
jgi:hypothetical protein